MYLIHCPHPSCGHIAEMITNAHCKRSHGVTKREILEEYGSPQPVEINPKKIWNNRAVNERTHKEVTKQLYK